MNSALPSLSVDLEDPYTVPLNSRFSVRLYRDCRPNYLETGALQKGLVLLFGNRELIEEGVGFGVPVVKYTDKTFFSSKATVTAQSSNAGYTLTKTYVLDTVSVKKIGNNSYLDDKIYSSIRKKFEILYLKHKKLNTLFNKVMETRELLKIKTEFQTRDPRGTISVTYNCQPNALTIYADLSKVNLQGCQEVLLLNEQGSSIFQKYVDSSGRNLLGNKIGAWDQVEADSAALQSFKGNLGFGLHSVGGSSMYRGWEHTRHRFSWAGLSYSLPPNNGVFCYSIDLDC